MSLRPRLFLTIAGCALPLIAGLVWMREDLDRRALTSAMAHFVRALMSEGGREDCELSPATFPATHANITATRPPAEVLSGASGPPRPGESTPAKDKPATSMAASDLPEPPAPPLPPRSARPAISPRFEYWAYGADFRSRNPRAPPFPDELAERLHTGAETASSTFMEQEQTGLQVAVRMPWDEGPCTVMLVRDDQFSMRSGVRGHLWSALALAGGILLAVLIAAGGVVRRIGVLTESVRRSAASHYQTPIALDGDDEITELARAFTEAGEQVRKHLATLAEREQSLRAFVANTTHDVAIPLTVLQGQLVAIREKLTRGETVAATALASALEETHYMGALIHNLAVAAKLEAGAPAMEKAKIDLAALVERVASRHLPLAHVRNMTLEFAVPEAQVAISGDITLIEQAISNLVHNAVRYNHDGGHVALVLETEGQNASRFRLRVFDDGPGVEDAELPRLIERSFRTDAARSRRPDGLGLGLAIAHDVATRHGYVLSFRRSEYGGLEADLSGPTQV